MHEENLSKDDQRITTITIKNEDYSSSYGFEVTSEKAKSFFKLCSAVYQCGKAAKNNQTLIHRSLKADGSILTETDLAVSEALLKIIKENYPNSNIITEEIDNLSFNENCDYTFILDPIDGTDSYSQGLATWCISLGILDSSRKPCASIVYAPRFGIGTEDLFLCSMPNDDKIYLNGKQLKKFKHYEIPKQITLGSNLLKYTDLSSYEGKIRSFGSSILHLLAPLVFSNIDACMDPLCYVWDIAGAHALALKAGLEVCYCDGSAFIYDDSLLLERKQIKLPLLSGNKGSISYMKENFKVNLSKLR